MTPRLPRTIEKYELTKNQVFVPIDGVLPEETFYRRPKYKLRDRISILWFRFRIFLKNKGITKNACFYVRL